MYGFLYRDLRVARPMLIAAVVMLVYTIAAPIFGALSLCKDPSDMSGNNLMNIICYGMMMFFPYMVLGEQNKADEKRLPVYFAISSPAGLNGYVKSKYLTNLLFPFAFFCISFLTDTIACAIIDVGTDEIVPTSYVGISSALLQGIVLLSSIELPFMFRFGVKKGANLKAGIFLTVIAAAGIYFLFGDISMFGSVDDFMQFLLDLSTGARGGTTIAAISALMPILTLVLYYLSYLLSCKLYLKGVEQFEQ